MIHETAGDKIRIEDLSLKCVIGVNPEERSHKQKIKISVTVFTDTRKAGTTDSIEDTIDYSMLAKKIVGHVEQSSCMLIEKLADEIATICLAPAGSQAATVRVEKPGALKLTKKVSVEICRSKDPPIEET